MGNIRFKRKKKKHATLLVFTSLEKSPRREDLRARGLRKSSGIRGDDIGILSYLDNVFESNFQR